MNHVKKLRVPVICFPRGIDDYKNFCDVVDPDMINSSPFFRKSTIPLTKGSSGPTMTKSTL